MEDKDDELISIDVPKGDFESFLEIEENKRIFFSGKYGSGKTFFLKHFFEEHKEKYDVYHLFPTRYQITSNDNIVDLLKYDIFVELLKKYPDTFRGEEVKGVDLFKLFIAFCKDRGSINGLLKSTIKTGEEVLALIPDPLFQILSKLGRPLEDLLNIDKEFQEFKSKQLAGEKGAVDSFLKEVSESKDVMATDYLSYLLYEKIVTQKAAKESVLILDDFDRIDPDHIFRILNVLSAHMDGEEENKFGFDQIIIVGDIGNIQSIFHHKYGERTDFWGYFDKFFSVHPFSFNNEKAVTERIPQLLQRIKHDESGLSNALQSDGITKLLLEEILVQAFPTGDMTLRQLFKPLTSTFPQVRKGTYKNGHFADSFNQCVDIGIKLLIALYGDKENLLKVLQRIREVSPSVGRKSEWFYREYANSMLRRMVKLDPGTNLTWLDQYPVVASQDEQSSRQVNVYPNGTANAEYFFDTLIEYIKRGKYLKNWREYES